MLLIKGGRGGGVWTRSHADGGEAPVEHLADLSSQVRVEALSGAHLNIWRLRSALRSPSGSPSEGRGIGFEEQRPEEPRGSLHSAVFTLAAGPARVLARRTFSALPRSHVTSASTHRSVCSVLSRVTPCELTDGL